ncbi:venom carboxylesterase-6 [Nomia melanderi]|uniref:venom carboxylesterase-6 n=1 Tax=Nomia melanderi TaxID=2448451 RepID=UPI001304353C|nr:venom carboxylesterase-6-like [Nomia melanderi]
MKVSIVLVFLGIISLSSQKQEAPRVNTPLGSITGTLRKSHSNHKYESYEGIPYARPPVKSLRFRPPKPAKRWEHELFATKKGPVCMQYLMPSQNGSRVIGEEDCLYLNIYTPHRGNRKPLLPVMFWIHGGAFQFGSGNEADETRLMDRKIVLVTINYRLGPFGFLSTGDRVVLGNMGLKDQNVALRWVSDNIAYFGGDPKSVTIFGVSAGASSVHYHYMSTASAGLFQRGISISGVALDPWSQNKRAPERAKKLGALMDCPTHSSEKMVECLRNRPAHLISEAVGDFMVWLYNPSTPFAPVIERQKCPRPFIKASPIEIITKGEVLDVPWISGVVSEEGLYPAAEFIADEKLLRQLNDNWDNIAPYLLDYNDTIPLSRHKEVAEKARKHYLGSKEISSDTALPLTHMIGDRLFAVDFEKAVRAQAKVNKSPVWTYYYTYRATHSLSESLSHSNKNFGVSHTDDIYLVINPALANTKNFQDIRMQKRLIDFYTSFAIKGVPKIGTKWREFEPEEERFRYLRISGPRNISMSCSKNFGQKDFWNTIDFDENKL